ncbi:MAG: M81 family metallopeptidase [Alphaproteobacteria bacterium]|nr:M81 family metallopeptidase [Alphaproteobacteria bacterium]
MRLVVAMMKHETNTFSPVPTDLARFGGRGLHRGAAVVENYAGTNTPIAAYIDLARAAGAELVTPIAAEAPPSGPVQRAAYEEMAGAIVEAVARGCDGVMLDLHGAMVAEHHDDGEGELLARIRAAAPGIPICVTLDMHCNLTQRMVDNCTMMIGYKTYPHVDMREVGERIGRVFLRSLAGEIRPVMVWANAPVLAQTLRMGTADEPMRGLQAMAREAEAGPILAATFFGGFPMADIHDAGVSAVVVADGDAAAAGVVRDRLLARAWEARADFVYAHRDLAATVAEAKRLQNGIPPGRPVVLLDHADNVASGGTSDVMTVIAEVLRQDLPDVAVATVFDPDAVQAMRAAGLGARIALDLGGRAAMPSIGGRPAPLRVTGTVAHLGDGRWRIEGPMYTGLMADTGPSAVLDTGRMRIVIVSRHHEPFDTGIFTANGIDPTTQRYLLLKSRIHYRAGFAPLASHTFTCDGEGVTTSDNKRLRFDRVRRPIYPLDPG